jgi:hypothetical protein
MLLKLYLKISDISLQQDKRWNWGDIRLFVPLLRDKNTPQLAPLLTNKAAAAEEESGACCTVHGGCAS